MCVKEVIGMTVNNSFLLRKTKTKNKIKKIIKILATEQTDSQLSKRIGVSCLDL